MSPNANSPESLAKFSPATLAIHGDDGVQNISAVAPPIHVSTTFRYEDDPDKLVFWTDPDLVRDSDTHVYSRDSTPTTNRLEAVLSALLGGHALTYASGLAAFHAMMVHLKPKRVAIGQGYHGCHGVLELLNRLYGLEKVDLDSDEIGEGDVIHVETPLNPTGEARDLAHYAAMAHKVGAYLTVDATFAPPPLLAPFDFGADIVMHSGTKYFGGHSDMLAGVLAVAPSHAADGWWASLKHDRLLLGSVMGNFEGWLGLRSTRTLELRVKRQSETATRLVKWLHESGLAAVDHVSHASLQPEASQEGSWLREQMPNGYGAVFGLYLKNEKQARHFPSKTQLFHHCTSLGGVESTIEWRRMSDVNVDTRLLRVSIGLESLEDLQADIKQALEAVADLA